MSDGSLNYMREADRSALLKRVEEQSISLDLHDRNSKLYKTLRQFLIIRKEALKEKLVGDISHEKSIEYRAAYKEINSILTKISKGDDIGLERVLVEIASKI